MAPTSSITEAADDSDLEALRDMRERLDNGSPPKQAELNRFLLLQQEKVARQSAAQHRLLHEVVESIREVRDEIRLMRRLAYGVGVGASVLWFLLTQTNVRPQALPEPPKTAQVATP